MRKTYLDNIRWITVSLVVIYHVIYMFNGVTQHGIIGPFRENQPQDLFQYMVYPWFMLLLFLIMCVSGIGPLWYIQLLWLFSILLLVIRKIDKDRLWRLCGDAGTVAALVLTVVIYGSALWAFSPL